jgi:hypothetical protein
MSWRTAPPLLVVAFLSACASPVAVLGDDDSPPPKSPVIEAASTNSASKFMVAKNPDGTITFRKEPPTGDVKGANVKKRLLIPAQIVAPIASAISTSVPNLLFPPTEP